MTNASESTAGIQSPSTHPVCANQFNSGYASRDRMRLRFKSCKAVPFTKHLVRGKTFLMRSSARVPRADSSDGARLLRNVRIDTAMRGVMRKTSRCRACATRRLRSLALQCTPKSRVGMRDSRGNFQSILPACQSAAKDDPRRNRMCTCYEKHLRHVALDPQAYAPEHEEQ